MYPQADCSVSKAENFSREKTEWDKRYEILCIAKQILYERNCNLNGSGMHPPPYDAVELVETAKLLWEFMNSSD